MKIDYDILEQACNDADLDPEHAIRSDYSGRGMCGDECLGLVHDTVDELLTFTISLVTENDIILHGARQDSVGRSTITYWPRVSVVGGESSC